MTTETRQSLRALAAAAALGLLTATGGRLNGAALAAIATAILLMLTLSTDAGRNDG